MPDTWIDFALGVAETVAWCLLVGLLAGAIGFAVAELRFRRRRKR